jgi:hypothetical protein
MHPTLSLAIASAREQDIRRQIRDQRRLGLGLDRVRGDRGSLASLRSFSRYFTHAGTSDQRSLRRPRRGARRA